MTEELWKLHDHFLYLGRYYSQQAEIFREQEDSLESEFWAGKSYAIQYAAFLLGEELPEND